MKRCAGMAMAGPWRSRPPAAGYGPQPTDRSPLPEAACDQTANANSRIPRHASGDDHVGTTMALAAYIRTRPPSH